MTEGGSIALLRQLVTPALSQSRASQIMYCQGKVFDDAPPKNSSARDSSLHRKPAKEIGDHTDAAFKRYSNGAFVLSTRARLDSVTAIIYS